MGIYSDPNRSAKTGLALAGCSVNVTADFILYVLVLWSRLTIAWRLIEDDKERTLF